MKLPEYNTENYEDYFIVDESNFEDSVEERIEKLRDKQVSKYRVKTIRSGPMLEVEVYPIHTPCFGKRARKEKDSRIAQSKLNDTNAKKHLVRLLNTNVFRN